MHLLNIIKIFTILRLKDVQQEKYTRDEAERGAGMSVEILPSVNASRMVTTI